MKACCSYAIGKFLVLTYFVSIAAYRFVYFQQVQDDILMTNIRIQERLWNQELKQYKWPLETKLIQTYYIPALYILTAVEFMSVILILGNQSIGVKFFILQLIFQIFTIYNPMLYTGVIQKLSVSEELIQNLSFLGVLFCILSKIRFFQSGEGNKQNE